MNHDGGMPLDPVSGRWFIHGQPRGWSDSDPRLHGYFNRNISVTMNVAPGTTITITMKSGDDIIFLSRDKADSPFESYPTHWSDDSGLTPSGIEPDLVGLQYIETRIIVREKEYYDKRKPVTVDFEFKQGDLVYKRTYQLSLTWDHYFSGKPNPFVTDLVALGIPFMEKHGAWNGWQPLTGEYQYVSEFAQLEFNGYYVGCFWQGGAVKINFPAMVPFQKAEGPGIVGPDPVGGSLDICAAGIHEKSTIPHKWEEFEMKSRGHKYYLLQTSHGTYMAEPLDETFWKIYLVTQGLPLDVLKNFLKGDKDLSYYRDYNKDPLGHHRLKLNGVTFWEVVDISYPSPALGGSLGGSVPSTFKVGVMNFIATYPGWYKRFGPFPKED